MNKAQDKKSDVSEVLDTVTEKLRQHGIVLENLCCDNATGSRAKVVCIEPHLGNSVKEMGKYPRGETLMVRINEETRNILDAWVETGYFKSRSEAAALFMNEGLKIRASELERLNDAIQKVKQAKNALQNKAGEIFGEKKE
jgi:Arc/MetJ-type ribon-helix-helix transcriptional regulator